MDVRLLEAAPVSDEECLTSDEWTDGDMQRMTNTVPSGSLVDDLIETIERMYHRDVAAIQQDTEKQIAALWHDLPGQIDSAILENPVLDICHAKLVVTSSCQIAEMRLKNYAHAKIEKCKLEAHQRVKNFIVWLRGEVQNVAYA